MNFYSPLYSESEQRITLDYDTIPNNDIEVILQSMVAYKKLVLRSAMLLTGDYTDTFEENLPEILMVIDKYYKGSDVFEYIMKLVPKKHQQVALVACTIPLAIGGLLWTANQILDLYIKINKINEVSAIEQKFEEFKNEVNKKLQENNGNMNNDVNNTEYSLPSSLYKVIDYTYDDYQTFIKPVKIGAVRKITLKNAEHIISELNTENSLDFGMEIVNQKVSEELHDIKFTKIDKTNKKSWKVKLEDGTEAKAEIKDDNFFKKVELMQENPLNKDSVYKANTLEYWQREKGEEILSLRKIDILLVAEK